MWGYRASFKAAFWAILLAILLPGFVILGYTPRKQKLVSSTTAKSIDSETRKSDSADSVSEQDQQDRSRAKPAQPKSQSDSLASTPRADVPTLGGLTGSVSGRSSIEIAVRERDPDLASYDPEGQKSNEIDPRHAIIFRPVDDEGESNGSEATRRLELELRSVRQRLDRLAQQQQQLQAREAQQDSQLLAREAEILDALRQIGNRAGDQKVIVELRQNEPRIAAVDHSPASTPMPTPVPARVPDPDEATWQDPTPIEVEQPKVVSQPKVAEQPIFERPTPFSHRLAARISEEHRLPSHHATDPAAKPTPSPEPSEFVEKPKTPLPVAAAPDVRTPERTREKPMQPEVVSFAEPPARDASDSTDQQIQIRSHSKQGVNGVYSMDVQNADIRQFFGKLGAEVKVNFLLSPEVNGPITLCLHEVPFEPAMKAILKSQHLAVEREGDVAIILTADEAHKSSQQNRQLVAKIYQPNYLSTSEFNRLIEPLISPDGRHSIAAPCPTGVGQSADAIEADWDQRDAVVVRDYPEVIDQIDHMLIDLDLPPLQVSIEAQIYSIRLTGAQTRGLELRQLPCRHCDSSCGPLGQLKHADLACDVPTFVNSARRLGEVRAVSSQQIRVLNKHRAEMVIGDRIGMLSKTGDRIAYLESGTRLIFRPSISADGSIRMGIHPEQSFVTTDRRTNQPQQTVAELTTQLLVRDGATIALSGLFYEEAAHVPKKATVAQSFADVATPFRHRRERTERTELMIFITPHIITDCTTESAPNQFEATLRDQAERLRNRPLKTAQQHAARGHYDRAMSYFRQGNLVKARQQIEASLRTNTGDREAIGLRTQIDQRLAQRSND